MKVKIQVYTSVFIDNAKEKRNIFCVQYTNERTGFDSMIKFGIKQNGTIYELGETELVDKVVKKLTPEMKKVIKQISTKIISGIKNIEIDLPE